MTEQRLEEACADGATARGVRRGPGRQDGRGRLDGVVPRIRPGRLLVDRPRAARQPHHLRRLRARLGHEGGDPLGGAGGGRGGAGHRAERQRPHRGRGPGGDRRTRPRADQAGRSPGSSPSPATSARSCWPARSATRSSSTTCGPSGSAAPRASNCPARAPASWRTPTTGAASGRPTSPIGQGVSVTTLQMASIYQAIANDGVRVEPRIVDSVTRPDGRVSEAPAPEGTRVISEATAEQDGIHARGGGRAGRHRAARRRSRASASPARPAPRSGPTRSAAATTAAATSPRSSASHPADDPQYVVAVDLERPTSDAEGGQVAAPVFADIMRYALTADGIVPSGHAAAGLRPRPPPDRARAAAGRAAGLTGRGARVRRGPAGRLEPRDPDRPRVGAPARGEPPADPALRLADLADLWAPRSARRRRSGDLRRHARVGRGPAPVTSTPRCPGPARTGPGSPPTPPGGAPSPSSPTRPAAATPPPPGCPSASSTTPGRCSAPVADRVYGEPSRAADGHRHHRHERQDDDGLPGRGRAGRRRPRAPA